MKTYQPYPEEFKSRRSSRSRSEATRWRRYQWVLRVETATAERPRQRRSTVAGSAQAGVAGARWRVRLPQADAGHARSGRELRQAPRGTTAQARGAALVNRPPAPTWCASWSASCWLNAGPAPYLQTGHRVSSTPAQNSTSDVFERFWCLEAESYPAGTVRQLRRT